jgi:hypothetical protein
MKKLLLAALLSIASASAFASTVDYGTYGV